MNSILIRCVSLGKIGVSLQTEKSMTVENFQSLLEAFLSREPFRVFTVEMNNGNRFEVDRPHTVMYRGGFAIFIAPGPVPIYFDNEGVVQIIDAPGSDAPGTHQV
jgi:hypothetical protein